MLGQTEVTVQSDVKPPSDEPVDANEGKKEQQNVE